MSNARATARVIAACASVLIVTALAQTSVQAQQGDQHRRNEDLNSSNCRGRGLIVAEQTDHPHTPTCMHADSPHDLHPDLVGGPAEVPAGESTTTRTEDSTITPFTNHCIGDGIAGSRFLAFYGYKKGTTANYTTSVIDKIRRKIGYADAYMVNSDNSYTQHLRFTCTGGLVDVKKLEVTDTDMNGAVSYFEVDDALQAAGYVTATDNTGSGIIRGMNHTRNYVVFMDNVDYPYCGASYLGGYNNTSPDTRGGLVADIRCWSGGTVLHELFHSLGAVQSNAPRHADDGHCKDNEDVMCYDGWASTNYCPGTPTWKADCGHAKVEQGAHLQGEDYWDPSGGQYYLMSYWNTSKSYFLKPPVLK